MSKPSITDILHIFSYIILKSSAADLMYMGKGWNTHINKYEYVKEHLPVLLDSAHNESNNTYNGLGQARLYIVRWGIN